MKVREEMFLDIRKRNDLLAKREEIADLFRRSFERELDLDDWQWFYVENPAGPAYVSLFYEHDRLLGHYAVVPSLLSHRGQQVIGYRSMTTMVHPDGRGRGLFTELANRTYAMLLQDGAPLVYGFPNGNSAHGFAKYLDWSLSPADRIVDFSGVELLKEESLIAALTADADLCWDVENQAQAAWRVSQPRRVFKAVPGLVTKIHEGRHNLLHIDARGLAGIDPLATYRVLVPFEYEPDLMESRKVMNHQFGIRFFDETMAKTGIKRELIMSDVF
jgi:GNAT superfamily N-acetyltransferase